MAWTDIGGELGFVVMGGEGIEQRSEYRWEAWLGLARLGGDGKGKTGLTRA